MRGFKKWYWIIGSIPIISLVICIFPWRAKINTTIKGIQCRIGDEDYSETVSITVEGEYTRYMLKGDTFEGKILIDGYNLTLDTPVLPLDFKDGASPLLYGGNIKGVPISEPFGFLSCTSCFGKMLIGVDEQINDSQRSWSGKDGLFICAPAENREQALKIAKSLSSKSGWLSGTDWH